MSEQLYCIALDSTGLPNKVATECVLDFLRAQLVLEKKETKNIKCSEYSSVGHSGGSRTTKHHQVTVRRPLKGNSDVTNNTKCKSDNGLHVTKLWTEYNNLNYRW